MSKYVYDVEVFKNYFCASFIEVDTEEVKQFWFSEGDSRNRAASLCNFLSGVQTLIGFNSLSYDDAILLLILRAWKSPRLNDALFQCSGRLIAEGNLHDSDVRELRWSRRSWKSVDLMKIMAFDKTGVGLKQAAITMGWHRIQDLPYEYDKEISFAEEQTVLDYNLNDAQITLKLYHEIEMERSIREEASETYGVDVISTSRSRMANVLLEKFYTEKNQVSKREIRDFRTRYTSIALKDCIPEDVKFDNPILGKVLEELRATKVHSGNKFKYDMNFYLDTNIYQLGVGGLHTHDKPRKIIVPDDYILRDADVASYYPAIALKNQVYPAHLDENFLDILRTIRDDRLAAKHSGQKTKAEALKITINSIVGKFGNPDFWLEDMKALLRVTIAGQLYLLMLAEKMIRAGVEVVSANTDGLLLYTQELGDALINEACQEWQSQLGLELEFTDYRRYIRRDVNNYLAEKTSGKIKGKGAFLLERDLQKALHHPVVSQALKRYFIEAVPIAETLQECQNILDFCISQKAGRQFDTEYHTRKGETVLQRNNRFFISTTGGAIHKRNKETGNLTALYSGEYVNILNDYDPSKPITDYPISYEFYRKQAYDIIDKLEEPFSQLSFL